MSNKNDYPLLAEPHIRLFGTIDEALYKKFRDELEAATNKENIVISLCTLGGNPEIARAMGDDIRLLKKFNETNAIFLGKQAVYSAGATFMSFFERKNRFLTKGTRLMIHERQLAQTITLNGPLSSCIATLEAKLNEVKQSIEIENEALPPLPKAAMWSSRRSRNAPRQTGISMPKKRRIWGWYLTWSSRLFRQPCANRQ